MFEAYAEFPVVLISGVAPRWPSAGLRAPQEAVSTPPQLPTALWHSLGRVVTTNCSDEGASPAAAPSEAAVQPPLEGAKWAGQASWKRVQGLRLH